MEDKPKLVVIGGPTGVGKTSAAIRVAQNLEAQIINADSMQIYRFMDIGTAKPTAAEKATVKHHLIDVVDPDHHFDAQCFVDLACPVLDHNRRNNRLTIVAGGTGLYIKALLYGLFEGPTVRDPHLRNQLRQEIVDRGPSVLFEELQRVDPASALRIHPNDCSRLVRALEVFKLTGRPISDWQARHRFAESRFDVFQIGLYRERTELYQRIDQRVDEMLRNGLLKEVQDLLARGYDPQLKSMQSIGYRQIVDYLFERCDWKTTAHLIKRDTRRYAKRQYTWFKKSEGIKWVTPTKIDSLLPSIKTFLSR